jgi:hypothetical protein
MNKLLPGVAEKLGYYVYAYSDPFDGKIFYVGKGKGNRVLAHLDDESENKKVEKIRNIRSRGKEPKIEIVVHGLKSEIDAFRIESVVIGIIGIQSLTNVVHGYENDIIGRIPLAEIIALYAGEPAEITEPSILIRINRLYRYDMVDEEIYEATRGKWKIGSRRNKAKYAFAIFRGIIREIYLIEKWLPSGAMPYNTGVQKNRHIPGRWEFAGSLADGTIRGKYLNKSAEHYFARGAQNPITYVNC